MSEIKNVRSTSGTMRKKCTKNRKKFKALENMQGLLWNGNSTLFLDTRDLIRSNGSVLETSRKIQDLGPTVVYLDNFCKQRYYTVTCMSNLQVSRLDIDLQLTTLLYLVSE